MSEKMTPKTLLQSAIEYVQDLVDGMDEEGLDRENNRRHFQALITAAHEAEECKKISQRAFSQWNELVLKQAYIETENGNLRSRIAELELSVKAANKYSQMCHDMYINEWAWRVKAEEGIAELEKQQVVEVTEEEYTQHLRDERELQKRYVPSGEFISKRYPFGLKIVGGG